MDNDTKNAFMLLMGVALLVVFMAGGYMATVVSAKNPMGYLAGKVMVGPCESEQCPQMSTSAMVKTYKARKIVVSTQANKQTVAETSIDANGGYGLGLPPGNYFVEAVNRAGPPGGQPKKVAIGAGITSIVDLYVDTGIR